MSYVREVPAGRELQIRDLRRRLSRAQLQNAAAEAAGVPPPWPEDRLAELDAQLQDLTVSIRPEQPQARRHPAA